MKNFIGTAVFAAALLCGGAPALAGQGQSSPAPDTSSATITGIVQSADGEPIENAVVVSEYGGQAVTRADGSFTLEVDVNAQAASVGLTAVASANGVNLTGNRLTELTGRERTGDAGTIVVHANGDCEPAWVPTFGGQPGVSAVGVLAMAVFDDGGGPALYVGGDFMTAGGFEVRHIAKWDGSSWLPLGSGMSVSGWVSALAVFDDGSGPALYAGGQFSIAGGVSAGRIAKWDGSSWSPLGSGVSSAVRALTVYDDGSGGGPALYAGGDFTFAGGINANRIAKWDGESWSPLGVGMNSLLWTLTVFDDGGGPALYAGGEFTSAGGISANRIAKWDGSSWSALGSGVSGGGNRVNALTVFDDGSGGGSALYAGGNFTTAGGITANRIAKWDGSSWSPLGMGMNEQIWTLTVFDDGGGPALYAGGWFTRAGLVSASHIAKWDGTAWSTQGTGANGFVIALTVFDDGSGGDPNLYAGGGFTAAGDAQASRVAKWDGSSWSALGDLGMIGAVAVLTVFDDGSGGGPNLYAGGWFTAAGGVSANRIARWDGSSWSPLGEGMNDWVGALTVFDDGSGSGPALYAGGLFTTAGGVGVNYIAKWDGSSWSPLGSGMNNFIRALTVFDDGGGPALYAGGEFTSAGGVTANRIAKWDGSSWSPLLSGVNGPVHDLAVFDDGSGDGPDLIVGGAFGAAGGVTAPRIAKWDGSSWLGLNSGMNGTVRAMTVFDDGDGPNLYAGGGFTTAGGVSANRIAKWNGSSWSPLGSGVSAGSVYSLTVFDDGSGGGPNLYAGGGFISSGGVEVNRIAKWDGLDWSPLGSGIVTNDWGARVYALTVFDDSPGSGGGPALFAGGSFAVSPAGDSYLAKWQGCPTEPPCALGDLNCDGVVDVSDLLILLASWGLCPRSENCPADLNGDGAVDVSDLLILLANWG